MIAQVGAIRRFVIVGAALSLLFTVHGAATAQELEPRRWSHLPKNVNILGAAYAYTDADISFDPALRIEDGEQELRTYGLKYIRTFDFFGKSGRLDLLVPYQESRWEGLLDGEPRSRRANGLADPVLRFAVNLLGAPPLQREEYRAYRSTIESETIVGFGLAMHAPLGEYEEDKLLNIGQNRFIFRPQLGMVHSRGPWSVELTGSVWFFTDNDDFFDDMRREQDPLLAIQSQVVYSLRPGIWIAAAGGYGSGAESRIDGERKRDDVGNLAWALSFGFPFTRSFGGKIAYIGTRTQESTGSDSDTLTAGVVQTW